MRVRPHRTLGVIGAAVVLGTLMHGGAATAAPQLRAQVEQKGDFVLIGNTLGHECSGGVAPIVGAVGACGNNLGDSAPDVYWRSDAPAGGQAEANNMVTAAQARSTAMLAIPPGATITHAYLYWAARNPSSDLQVTLDGPNNNTLTVPGAVSATNGNEYYQSVADVTSFVQTAGVGAYRVSNVASTNIVGLNENTSFAGWWLTVLYELPTDPPRNLAIFDGLDLVQGNNTINVPISGFLVPTVGFDAKLGVITYEGDSSITGDTLAFNGVQLSNASNPANNFFNGSRTFFGSPVTVPGDLPQLTGGPGSMSGMDMDVVDISAALNGGDTSATITASSTGDFYFLAGFVTSISTFAPDFSSSGKTVVDLNGGSLVPGDVLEYTIDVVNAGNDTAVDVVLEDAIPTGTTYVPGSLEIVSGANAGAKTDAADGDQGEYDAIADAVFVRLGAGADGTNGGAMLVGETAQVKFRVTIDAGANGTISNQAIITASGLLGAPPTDTPTDGNGPSSGQPPTDVIIDACDDDGDCSAPTPFCNVVFNPNACVECLTDANCGALEPTCDGTGTCVCIPTGSEVCGDAIDNDCNGVADDGCDDDMDGLLDSIEVVIGTNPNDADSDDDGVPDGQEPDPGGDADGDGIINALDPDSDNDGIFDGTELGLGCSSAGTNQAEGNCVADADGGQTVTNPLDADTDDGGLADGLEDTNHNGAIDAGEKDPNDGSDDLDDDPDLDGLTTAEETAIGTNPNDADSDDDGVIDGQEPQHATDSDGDGLINALDPDSDNDGLLDGTELGLDCSNADTGPTCVADADPSTTTDPLDADTDDGGVSDGSEDADLDGAIDPGETDPNDGSDDVGNPDTDGDGLSDSVEIAIGTDPNDADSDDDGVIDGAEVNPSVDTDGDGLINALDPDSDDDGILDGTELGTDCSNPATDAAICVPDGDGGATTTSPVLEDTDGGGKPDGEEDLDHDGVIDEGESDPNEPSDDFPVACDEDSDCGGPMSGIVCNEDTSTCEPGCRGQDGNGCPTGEVCTSMDATIGQCVPDGVGGGGAGGGGAGGGQVGGGGAGGGQTGGQGGASDEGFLATGNGLIDCSTSPRRAPSNGLPVVGALLGLGALALRRRRR